MHRRRSPATQGFGPDGQTRATFTAPRLIRRSASITTEWSAGRGDRTILPRSWKPVNKGFRPGSVPDRRSASLSQQRAVQVGRGSWRYPWCVLQVRQKSPVHYSPAVPFGYARRPLPRVVPAAPQGGRDPCPRRWAAARCRTERRRRGRRRHRGRRQPAVAQDGDGKFVRLLRGFDPAGQARPSFLRRLPACERPDRASGFIVPDQRGSGARAPGSPSGAQQRRDCRARRLHRFGARTSATGMLLPLIRQPDKARYREHCSGRLPVRTTYTLV